MSARKTRWICPSSCRVSAEARTVGLCVKRPRISWPPRAARRGDRRGQQQHRRIPGHRRGRRRPAWCRLAKGYGAALSGGIAAARTPGSSWETPTTATTFQTWRVSWRPHSPGPTSSWATASKAASTPGPCPLHRYFGTPILSALARFFSPRARGDVQCGLRAFRQQGVCWTSAFAPRAWNGRAKCCSAPPWPDGDSPKSRFPSTKTGADVRRTCAPGGTAGATCALFALQSGWVFWFPALLLVSIGALLLAVLAGAPRRIHGLVLDVHTYFYAAVFVTAGVPLFCSGGVCQDLRPSRKGSSRRKNGWAAWAGG